MRTLRVILALVILTGAQARYFWQHDEPQQTAFQHLQESGQAYMEFAQKTAQEVAAQFDSSVMGQELEMNAAEKLEALGIILREVRAQIAPEVQEIVTELKTVWQNLKQEMTKDLEGVRAKIQPILRKLRENVQQEVVTYFQNVKTISGELHQMAQEKLMPVAESFRDKVRHHVDHFRKDVAPFAEQLKGLLHEKAQVLRQKGLSELTELQAELQQQMSTLRETYGPVWQKTQEELNSLLETVKSSWANLDEAPEQKSS